MKRRHDGHGLATLIVILTSVTLLSSSCNCMMSDQEKWNLANGYMNNYKANIIGSRYGGGENIYHEIIAVDYNCNGSNMKIGSYIRFTGQYSGAHYWVKGIMDIDRNTGNYTFRELDKDRDLALALKFQGILEDAATKSFNELLEEKSPENNEILESQEEEPSNPNTTEFIDSTEIDR